MLNQFIPVSNPYHVHRAYFEHENDEYVVLFLLDLYDVDCPDYDILKVCLIDEEETDKTYENIVDYSLFKPLVFSAVEDQIPCIIDEINELYEEEKWEMLRQENEDRLLSKC